jgi:hypothetical protein
MNPYRGILLHNKNTEPQIFAMAWLNLRKLILVERKNWIQKSTQYRIPWM